MNTTFENEGVWSDEMLNGSRRPMLVVVADGKMSRFDGAHIPGELAIVKDTFRKNGKWSGTTYTFRLAEGVKAFEVVKALHAGPWLSSFDGWDAVAEYFGVGRTEAERFFRSLPNHGKGVATLDDREAALSLLKK